MTLQAWLSVNLTSFDLHLAPSEGPPGLQLFQAAPLLCLDDLEVAAVRSVVAAVCKMKIKRSQIHGK